MNTDRLAAFSDGVLAIIITIMVLELKVPPADAASPHAASLADLKPLLPVFYSYVLSSVFVALLWLVPDRRIERTLARREKL